LFQPPLIKAVFTGDIEEVQLLLGQREDVNFQDSEKRSPLHAAAFRGDACIAEALILNGARVNTKDAKWLTPLHRACCSGSEVSFTLSLTIFISCINLLNMLMGICI
jgi:serine/threonine-protein phosphatase 6 regulatory ankyrin repeat subunit A